MRIDHHAYQRAARVASFGLLLQFVIGLILLVFGLNLNDTAFVFGSMYTLSGLVVWLGLIVIFYQHKLECLEALRAAPHWTVSWTQRSKRAHWARR